jgi:hypothetical protein
MISVAGLLASRAGREFGESLTIRNAVSHSDRSQQGDMRRSWGRRPMFWPIHEVWENLAMNDEWQYTCAGVHLVRGIKQYATKGYIAIDASGDLILYNNKAVEFDRAPVADPGTVVHNGMAGTSITLHGKKYRVQFHALSQNFFAMGGLVGAAIGAGISSWAGNEDDRTETKKRDDLLAAAARLKKDA